MGAYTQHYLDQVFLNSAMSTGDTISHFIPDFWGEERLTAYSGDTGFFSGITLTSGGYDSFDAYPVAPIVTGFLDLHSGWDNAWEEASGFFGFIGSDDFEDYADNLGLIDSGTNQISGIDINSGSVWSGGWNITVNADHIA